MKNFAIGPNKMMYSVKYLYVKKKWSAVCFYSTNYSTTHALSWWVCGFIYRNRYFFVPKCISNIINFVKFMLSNCLYTKIRLSLIHILVTVKRKTKWAEKKSTNQYLQYAFIPVSYTHLDVYKRQLLLNSLLQKSHFTAVVFIWK